VSLRALVLLASVATVCLPSDVRAYCRATSPPWSDVHPMRVVLHAELDDQLRHTYMNGMVACTTSAQCGTGGLCVGGYATAPLSRCQGPVWTRNELVRSARRVIARINDWAGADVPHVYLDTTVEPTCDWSCGGWSSCYQANTVVVIPSRLIEQATFSGGLANRSHVVHISTSGSIPPCGAYPARPGFAWDHMLGTGGNTFDNALLHELGHSLGLGHVNNELADYPTCVPNSPTVPLSVCPTDVPFCSIMNGDEQVGSFVAHTWFRDDIQGLRALYGIRTAPDVRSFEDPDITSSSFSERTTTDTVLEAQMFGVSSWTASGRTSVSMAGNIHPFLDHYSWDFTGGSIAWLGTTTPPFEPNAPIGVTETSTERIVVTHGMRLTSDARRYDRRLTITRRALAGGAFSTTSNDPADASAGDTNHGGVSTAFDPNSGAIVTAFRDSQSRVMLVGWSGGVWSYPVPTNIRSYSQPVVACAPSTCLLVLSQAMDTPTITISTMQWVEFTWTQSGTTADWNEGLLYTTPWAVDADQSISVVGRPGGGYDFLVLQPFPAHLGSGVFGTQLWSFRHTAGTTTMVSHFIPVVSIPNVRALAAAGGRGTYAEAFTFAAY
jgi:hypothetical protein